MIYFRNLTGVDRITFEGREVKKALPIADRATKQITHYMLVVMDAEGEPQARKFLAQEIPHLIESELLVVDKGYYSAARQTDRSIYGDREITSQNKKTRARIDRVNFLARRVQHYHSLGMKLTPDGVHDFRQALADEYQIYQSVILYGTSKPNATQSLKILPSNTTLLKYYRDLRHPKENDSRVFLPPRSKQEPLKHDHQKALDRILVLRQLYEYASGTCVSKKEVSEKTVEAVLAENERRRSAGYPAPMKVLSADRYSRYIDLYLDPYVVTAARKGVGRARKDFGSVEKVQECLIPGQKVQFDAWMLHVVSLDTRRDRWLRMTADQRRKVKRVRRWVVMAIDVATRVILGFALCRHPNQAASLEALRMCYMDKTPLLREIGLTVPVWDFRAPISLVVTDSGSEFGKHPFGGAEFGEAVRRLSGSFMNTTAGIPELRGYIERLFLTFDLRWARFVPGHTSSSPQKLNDRKPYEEACLTDDEVYRQILAQCAEYNTTDHRGLNGFTPAGMWKKLTQEMQFDPTQLPMPKALREACGLYMEANITQDGVCFENVTYSNEFIRSQRTALGVDKIASMEGKVEIKVDVLDLGAISVLAGEDLITVPAVDVTMRGKTLSKWRHEQAVRRAHALLDKEAHSEARKEAQAHWRGEADAIAKSAEVDVRGCSIAELSRSAMELSFGKGHHEKPFIGRLEYADPTTTGFSLAGEENGYDGTDTDQEDEPSESRQTVVQPDAPNSMDRFRSKVKPRSSGNSSKGEK